MPPPTRSTRQSSRRSSPFAVVPRDSPAPALVASNTEQKQSTSQQWTEPPRAPLQPSFMDHHFDRTSIFQDMQPLGVMPSAKLKQKIRDNYARKVVTGETVGSGAVEEERGSTETTPAAETQRSSLPAAPLSPKRQQEAKPQEQTPGDPTKPPERTQRLKITNLNGVTPTPSASNTPPRAPLTNSHSRQVSASSIQFPSQSQPNTPSPLKSPIKMSPHTHAWNKESADAALAEAVRYADKVGGRSAMISKLALMEAFRLSEHDDRLNAALAATGAGFASIEQERRFKNYIKRSKKRLRKKLETGDPGTSITSFSAVFPDNSVVVDHSQANLQSSLKPELGSPATNISAQFENAHQPSRTTTPPGNPPPTSFRQPLADSNNSASPQDPSSAMKSTSPRPSTPKIAEVPSAFQTPQARPHPDDELLQSEVLDTPGQQSSGQSSDGELSDVNETLIRRVENETYMRNQGNADSGDDRLKSRKRMKDRRVAKGQPGAQHRKRQARERAQDAAEEEQRLDDERKRYRERYLQEKVPKFPKKDDYVESYVRTSPTSHAQDPLVNGQPPAASTRSQRQRQEVTVKSENPSLGEIQLNGARKRAADELDDSASSLTEDLGSTPFNSTPGTPVLAPPSKKQKTVAKTKISPIKSRNGLVTGVSRPGGGRGTPFANDDNDKLSDDEHSDFCGTCGGEGELLCCDGCDAAYHFECCDPPLTKDSPELEAAWYCPKCRPSPRRSRETSPEDRDSLWGDMSKIVFHYSQKNFQLPKSLQNYFEDNSVGLDGEYVTGQVTYSRASHAKDGIEEHADYYRLVDKKENPILCCQCLQGVGFENTRRPIIQCDKLDCSAYWHLDCLDPPLANPPTRGWQKGYQKTRLQWICPRHAEHDYREMLNPAFVDASNQMISASASTTVLPRHRMRVPRKPEYTDYHRGVRALSRVDVINRDDDDATLRFYEDEDLEGKVVRMPEDDVKLNFIAKVKADRMLLEPQSALRHRKLSHVNPAFQRRSFNDQRAALSLAQLAERQDGVDLNADGVAQLVYALTAQAEGEVDGGDIAPSFDFDINDRKQREQLIKVRRLIDMALANGEHPVRVARAHLNGLATSSALALQLPEGLAESTPVSFPRASSAQPTRSNKRPHLDIADNDMIEVRSEGGFEPRLRLSNSLDEREAISAPGSRPSSRRETRRTSNRKSAFGSK